MNSFVVTLSVFSIFLRTSLMLGIRSMIFLTCLSSWKRSVSSYELGISWMISAFKLIVGVFCLPLVVVGRSVVAEVLLFPLSAAA